MDCIEPDTLSSHLREEDEDIRKLKALSGLDMAVELICQCPKTSSIEKSQAVITSEEECQIECQSSKSSSIEDSLLAINGEHECQSQNVSFIDKSRVEVDGEECQAPKISYVNKYEVDIDFGPNSRRIVASIAEVSNTGVSIKDEEDSYLVPQVGMEFESEEHAYNCYSRYAVLEGFSIRKDFVNRSRINGAVVSRRYTCYKQGYRPAKHKTTVKKPRQETRTGCLAHMTIARQPNGKFRVSHFEAKHNHEFASPCTTHTLPSQKRLTFAEAVEADLANNAEVDGVPKLGMAFKSEDHAYDFYNTYAGGVGFSVRKDYVNRSKIDGAVASRKFTCFREGFRQTDKRDMNVKRPRAETRIGCLAQLVISRQPDGKYRVTHFEEKHNHELVAACRVHLLRSQKKLVGAQVVEGSSIGSSNREPKSTPRLICKTVGDCEGQSYDPIDYKRRLHFKCTREMREGEAGKMQQHFQNKQLKNSSFFYAMQPDADDQITNVFWADTKMVMDYIDFGDVVCLDTTHRLHKDCRPFAPFIGINHHKQMVIFGVALLYDETIDSYKWLFQTFIEAMSGKRPKTILADQDAVMAEAIRLILPETNHRICTWHVYQNALRQLGYTFAGSSCFVNDLSSCFFDHEEEEDFINAWNTMLDAYDLWENKWLHDIFEDREKWALAYGRRIFCADIKSALLCESFTTNLKRYLKSDSDVLPLLKHLAKVLNDWRYKELKANYDMSQHPPKLMGDVILLKQARNIYTPQIFELFQQEYETSLNIIVNQCTENGPLLEYKVSIYGQQREYTVAFNSSDMTISCNCMKFEFVGVLCCHALKVLDYRNVKLLPTQYILKRWTKVARA